MLAKIRGFIPLLFSIFDVVVLNPVVFLHVIEESVSFVFVFIILFGDTPWSMSRLCYFRKTQENLLPSICIKVSIMNFNEKI